MNLTKNEEGPQHVNRLNTLSKLKVEGFEGMDATLAICLFEYGLIWKEVEETNELLFVHKTSHGRNFERTTFDKNLDVHKEFYWVKFEDIYSFTGMPEEEWNKLPLPFKIYDLMNYYGVENIFGTSYWEGFEIITEND